MDRDKKPISACRSWVLLELIYLVNSTLEVVYECLLPKFLRGSLVTSFSNICAILVANLLGTLVL